MKLLKITAIFIPLLFAATFVLANQFQSSEDAYAFGFRAGYSHGVADRTAHLSFNFHSGSTGIRYASYPDGQFQRGFEDGYTDGFYPQPRSVQIVYTNVYDPQSFQIGYREGYRHGLSDREARVEFNYRNDYRFAAGGSYGTYSTAYQSGFTQGYSQGYDGTSVKISYRPEATVISSNPGLIIAFKDDDFEGKTREFPVGRYPKLHDGWNDSIGSVQIQGNVRVVLFEHDNFEGKQLVVERSTKDLDDFNFDDKAGSMIVERMN